MRAMLRVLGAVLALTVLTSCDSGDARPSADAQPTTPSASSPSAVTSSTPSQCALQAQPRRLLTMDDAASLFDLDAISQGAYQLEESCDQGPPWPRSCTLFGDLLSEGWPGYRTEGAYYIAAVNLLNTSGKSIEEQVLLFRTPNSRGLGILTEQAKACKATKDPASSQAGIYKFPSQAGRQRFLIIDQTVAILLATPSDVDAEALIKTARKRAMDAN